MQEGVAIRPTMPDLSLFRKAEYKFLPMVAIKRAIAKHWLPESQFVHGLDLECPPSYGDARWTNLRKLPYVYALQRKRSVF